MDPYVGLIPVQVVRADATLEAAGAWDTPTPFFTGGAQEIMLWFNYIRGGAAGAFDFQVEVSPYTSDAQALGTLIWSKPSVKDVVAFAAGADDDAAIQREGVNTYTAVGATDESFIYALSLSGAVERVRVTVRESGNVGAPGDVEIIASLR